MLDIEVDFSDFDRWLCVGRTFQASLYFASLRRSDGFYDTEGFFGRFLSCFFQGFAGRFLSRFFFCCAIFGFDGLLTAGDVTCAYYSRAYAFYLAIVTSIARS